GTTAGTVVVHHGITGQRDESFIQVLDTVFFYLNHQYLYIIRPDNSLYQVGLGRPIFPWMNKLLYNPDGNGLRLYDPITHSNTLLCSYSFGISEPKKLNDTVYYTHY